MSVDSLEKPTLWVEGKDDRFTIINLLERHGICLHERQGPVILKEGRNDRGVLNAMQISSRAQTRRPVGYVIDADTSMAHRWDTVRKKLHDLGIKVPAHPPADGLIEDSDDGIYRVGVWLMPDNTAASGAIEDFVRTLVPPGDKLFPHAERSTSEASRLKPQFSDGDRKKAELHCWLAWQKDPGCPFGQAIKANFFNHDSPQALAFVKWFRELYRAALGR